MVERKKKGNFLFTPTRLDFIHSLVMKGSIRSIVVGDPSNYLNIFTINTTYIHGERRAKERGERKSQHVSIGTIYIHTLITC